MCDGGGKKKNRSRSRGSFIQDRLGRRLYRNQGAWGQGAGGVCSYEMVTKTRSGDESGRAPVGATGARTIH